MAHAWSVSHFPDGPSVYICFRPGYGREFECPKLTACTTNIARILRDHRRCILLRAGACAAGSTAGDLQDSASSIIDSHWNRVRTSQSNRLPQLHCHIRHRCVTCRTVQVVLQDQAARSGLSIRAGDNRAHETRARSCCIPCYDTHAHAYLAYTPATSA